MGKQYTVSDGKLMLTLEEAEEGGFVVTSPDDRGLVTEADTIPEAFAMARDALRELDLSRAQLLRELPPEKRVRFLGKIPPTKWEKLIKKLPRADRGALERKLRGSGRARPHRKAASGSRA